MKLHEYINSLEDLVAGNPECKDMEVVFSVDHAGSSYDIVLTKPVIGAYDLGNFRSYKLMSPTERLKSDINAVCIN